METWLIMDQLHANVAYTYQILLSFKTSVTYKKKFMSYQKTVSFVKQLLLDITWFFVWHYLTSCATIQVCKPAYILSLWFIIEIGQSWCSEFCKKNKNNKKERNNSFCNLVCHFCPPDFEFWQRKLTSQNSRDKKHSKSFMWCNSSSKRANIKLESHHHLNVSVVQHTPQVHFRHLLQFLYREYMHNT